MESEPTNDRTAQQRLLLMIPFLATVAAGFVLRAYDVHSRSLEYDEIWTFLHHGDVSYWSTLTDLTVPNNHTLHSAAVKLSISIFGPEFFAIRLPALIAGLGCMLVVPWTVQTATRNRWAALLATGLVAFDPLLIRYARTARGYSLQCLLLATVIALMVWYWKREKGSRHPLFFVAFGLVPVLSVVLLPTSSLYLAALFVPFLCLLWATSEEASPQKAVRDDLNTATLEGETQSNRAGEHRSKATLRHSVQEGVGDGSRSMWTVIKANLGVLIATTVAASASLAWIIVHYGALKQSQVQFGRALEGLGGLLTFVKETTVLLGVIPWLLALALFLINRRCRMLSVVGLSSAAFPILAAVVSTGGPDRVYQPSLIIVYLAIGICFGNASFTKLDAPSSAKLQAACSLAAIALIGCIAPMRTDKLMPIDWQKAYPTITKTFGPECYLVFPAPVGFEIAYDQLQDVVVATTMRITPGTRSLVQMGMPSALEGVNLETDQPGQITTRQGSLAEHGEIEGIAFDRYNLVQLTAERDDGIVLLRIIGMDLDAYKAFVRNMKLSGNAEDWYILNGFLAKPLIDPRSGRKKISTMLFTDGTTLPAANLLEMQRQSGGMLSFFVLGAPTAP